MIVGWLDNWLLASWLSVRVFGILSRLEQMDQADIIDKTSFEGLPLHQAQINLFKVVLKSFQHYFEKFSTLQINKLIWAWWRGRPSKLVVSIKSAWSICSSLERIPKTLTDNHEANNQLSNHPTIMYHYRYHGPCRQTARPCKCIPKVWEWTWSPNFS